MHTNSFNNVVWIVVVFNLILIPIIALNDKYDLRITINEKNGLEELKLQISGKIKEDLMKTDFYLIRWLRKAKLNVQTAKNMILQIISWREENHISTILQEDFSDLEDDYPLKFKGTDKLGRPIMELDIGDWDLRAAVVQGKMHRLWRYQIYYTELCTKAIFEAQEKGKPVSRYVTLSDLNGANLYQHGCSLCVSFVAQWVSDYERYYPDFVDENIFINGPPLARLLTNTLRTFSPDLSSKIKVFDSNKAKWMQYLDQRIEKDQRSPRYGGSLKR